MTYRFGVRIRGAVFFLFGGGSLLEDDVDSPGAEFCIAFVGPLTSAVIGGCLIGLAYLVLDTVEQPVSSEGQLAIAACSWLGWMNVILVK